MSNVVHKLVLDRKVGSPTRKSLLLYMAYRASDDGSGVWASKPRMARELEMGERTVQKSTKELLNMGLISTAGRRRCSSGYTTVYQLNLKSIAALEPTNSQIEKTSTNCEANHPKGVQHVHPFDPVGKQQEVQDVRPTGAPDSSQEVQHVHPNHPLTIQEPSAAKAASTSDLQFAEFMDAHPRPRYSAESQKLLDALIAKGWSFADLLKAAQIYAEEQSSQKDPLFIAGSNSWLKRGGYEHALRGTNQTTAAELNSAKAIEDNYLNAIHTGNEALGKYTPVRNALTYIEQGEATIEQCRAVGISI
jgi:hypothetical protein